MTKKRFDYEYNHNILAYILTDNGEEITSFDAEGVSDEDIKIILDLLNSQDTRICALNKALSESLPVWVFERVIIRRIASTDNDEVKKVLKDLLSELK